MSKAEFLGAHQVDSSEEYIEVWNDLVSPRDLTWSLAICGGATVAALLIATLLSSSLFFWGLGGSVAGFIICAVMFSHCENIQTNLVHQFYLLKDFVKFYACISIFSGFGV